MIVLKSKHILWIYIFVVIANVVYLGCFGVLPAFKALKEKQLLAQELSQTVDVLVDKKEILSEAEVDFRESVEYRNALDLSIPYEEEIGTFLIDLVVLLARNEFDLQGFTCTRTSPQVVQLAVTVSGDEYSLAKVVSDLENMPRFVSISKVRIVFDSENAVSLSMNVYYLSKGIQK